MPRLDVRIRSSIRLTSIVGSPLPLAKWFPQARRRVGSIPALQARVFHLSLPPNAFTEFSSSERRRKSQKNKRLGLYFTRETKNERGRLEAGDFCRRRDRSIIA